MPRPVTFLKVYNIGWLRMFLTEKLYQQHSSTPRKDMGLLEVSDVLVADRAMYWDDSRGVKWASGHPTVGVPAD